MFLQEYISDIKLNLELVKLMIKKVKYCKTLLEEGDWTILGTFFHYDYFYVGKGLHS